MNHFHVDSELTTEPCRHTDGVQPRDSCRAITNGNTAHADLLLYASGPGGRWREVPSGSMPAGHSPERRQEERDHDDANDPEGRLGRSGKRQGGCLAQVCCKLLDGSGSFSRRSNRLDVELVLPLLDGVLLLVKVTSFQGHRSGSAVRLEM
jgi:hypothetical protein